ncbi:MAG: hypothetical protein ACI4W6_10765, partial [Acutalibacteraceae bacterium]
GFLRLNSPPDCLAYLPALLSSIGISPSADGAKGASPLDPTSFFVKKLGKKLTPFLLTFCRGEIVKFYCFLSRVISADIVRRALPTPTSFFVKKLGKKLTPFLLTFRRGGIVKIITFYRTFVCFYLDKDRICV